MKMILHHIGVILIGLLAIGSARNHEPRTHWSDIPDPCEEKPMRQYCKCKSSSECRTDHGLVCRTLLGNYLCLPKSIYQPWKPWGNVPDLCDEKPMQQYCECKSSSECRTDEGLVCMTKAGSRRCFPNPNGCSGFAGPCKKDKDCCKGRVCRQDPNFGRWSCENITPQRDPWNPSN